MKFQRVVRKEIEKDYLKRKAPIIEKVLDNDWELMYNSLEMNNSQIVTALLDLMSDFREVIDENRQEEAERLFKIAYDLIYSID